ncbi:MAG TPA: AMP-binding protein [bacterium]|nr:AMP-binding protein [bacterium]
MSLPAGFNPAPILMPQVQGVTDLIPHRFIQSWLPHAERTAIIDGGRGDAVFNYANLAMGAHLFASWLAMNTDMSAQNYGILLPSGMAFTTSFMAISMLGKTVVPLNFALAPRELADIVRDAGVTTLITFEPDPADKAGQAIFGATTAYLNDEILPLTPVLLNHHHIQGTIRQMQPLMQLPAINPDDTAVLLYTSGSTGKPKGVMMTHRNLTSNADAIAHEIGVDEKDHVMLGVLPTFHSFALTCTLLYPLFYGLATLFEPRFAPRTVLEKLAKHNVSIVLGVPSMYKAYMGAARGQRSDVFNTVKYLISGGAPLPPDVYHGFEQIFGKVIHEGYGTSETSPVISLNPLHEKPHLGTVGKCVRDVSVEIRGPQGDTLPAGEAGEIWVSGPNVTRGYHNQPEETAKVFRDGWYNTQDMGSIDHDGLLRILGRTKHMIIVGGENVYPAEVEAAVLQVPEVKDVAVTGIPDEKRGEAVHAFVVPADGWTGDPDAMEAIIRRYLSDHDLLGAYKMPAMVTLIPQIPLLPTGKPDLLALKGERQMIANVAVLQAQAAQMRADAEAAAAP